jgi:hypothetical protein
VEKQTSERTTALFWYTLSAIALLLLIIRKVVTIPFQVNRTRPPITNEGASIEVLCAYILVASSVVVWFHGHNRIGTAFLYCLIIVFVGASLVTIDDIDRERTVLSQRGVIFRFVGRLVILGMAAYLVAT